MEIDGYQVIDEIHRGPVTTVYKANHLALERIVLLKVLNRQWSDSEDLIERLRREARICSRLDHPSIVHIFDFGRSYGLFYISMEFIHGQNLAEYIHDHHPLPFASISTISRQIINGLAFAHRKQALHRDLKPSNIMISENGQIKITDFGLATISGLPQITEQGQVVGSPGYMSPEQIRNETLDSSSDLFSLGTTLYELCSGKSPFLEDNLGMTINNILNKNPDPLEKERPDIPDWYARHIHNLMAKEKSGRKPAFDLMVHGLANPENRGHDSELSDRPLSRLGENLLPRYGNRGELYTKNKRRITLTIAAPLFLLLVVIVIAIYGRNDVDMSDNLPSLEQSWKSGFRQNAENQTPIVSLTEKKSEPQVHTEKMMPEEEGGSDTSVKDKIVEDEPGHLYIRVTPWADVYIDSVYKDTTPLTKAFILPMGKHLLELRNPNSEVFREIVDIKAGIHDTLLADLKLKTGYLELQVVPWADIYINGSYFETTPVRHPISLPSGRHILTLRNPGFAALTDTIFIKTGKTLNKRIRLE